MSQSSRTGARSWVQVWGTQRLRRTASGCVALVALLACDKPSDSETGAAEPHAPDSLGRDSQAPDSQAPASQSSTPSNGADEGSDGGSNTTQPGPGTPSASDAAAAGSSPPSGSAPDAAGSATTGSSSTSPDNPEPAPTAPAASTAPSGSEPSPSASSPDAANPPGSDAGPACNPNDSLECPCPEGQLRCYGVCTDPLTNANHCGASDGCELTATEGVACQPLNAVCTAGACVPCSAPAVACANGCIDPSNDPLFCGAAPGCSPQESTRGARCWEPELCLDAVCVECLVFTARAARLPDYARQMALGDVTGDGLPDMVTVTSDEPAIVVLPGNGTQTTAEPLNQPFGESLRALGLGDLNGDEVLDVLVGDYGAGQVQAAFGNGDGTFEAGPAYPAPGGPRQLVLGDLDGNQVLDALVVNSDTNELLVLLGAGDGTFTGAQSITSDSALRAVTLGDINHDGNLDAALVGLAETITLLLGDGDGGFAVATHATAGYCSTVLFADLNSDGNLDLVVTPTLSGYNVEVSIGNGDGTFQEAHRLNASLSTDSVDGRPTSLAVADFDFDSQLDLAVGMQAGITLLWGHTNWAADNRRALTEYSEFTGLLAGDYDGDGVTDLLASLYNTNSNFRVYWGAVPAECPALSER